MGILKSQECGSLRNHPIDQRKFLTKTAQDANALTEQSCKSIWIPYHHWIPQRTCWIASTPDGLRSSVKLCYPGRGHPSLVGRRSKTGEYLTNQLAAYPGHLNQAIVDVIAESVTHGSD